MPTQKSSPTSTRNATPGSGIICRTVTISELPADVQADIEREAKRQQRAERKRSKVTRIPRVVEFGAVSVDAVVAPQFTPAIDYRLLDDPTVASLTRNENCWLTGTGNA